ncbi:MAG: ABC transporter substrate-binding protein [Polyangiales bacterium]|nr:ABC transporter substrate-binding protein [Myxococcales bacterium]
MNRLIAYAVTLLLGAAWVGHVAGNAWDGPAAQAEAARSAPRPPRIVSASLSTDEIALGLVAPTRLAAISYFADDPAASNVLGHTHEVRGRVTASVEELVSLEPTLVLADPFGHMASEGLTRRLGIPIVRTQVVTDLGDVLTNIHTIGRALDANREADALVASLRDRMAAVEARVHGSARPRVLVLYGRGFTVGTGTLVNDLLTRANAENVAALAGVVGHEEMSVERALALDPDVLVVSDYHADGHARDVRAPPEATDHPVWQNLRAVHEGRIVRMAPADLFTTSQYAVRALERLAAALHPQDGAPAERP